LKCSVQGQRRAGGARADPPFRPVGALHEEHLFSLAPQHPVAVDPEQATGLIADGYDQPGVEGMPNQQVVHHRQHRRQRMSAA